MQADRELLEKAAKAAGLRIHRWWFDVAVLYDQTKREEGATWNPLTHDGDALRLAVRLRITPHIDNNLTDAESDVGFATEPHHGDPYAATRRAIVRAAAALCDAKESRDEQ